MPIGASILAAATVASAGVGYLGSKSAAKTQSTAATDAASIQANASNRAADMQLGMFNTIRDDLAPYRSAGAAALPGYQALLGIPAARPAPAAPATAVSSSALTGAVGGSFLGAPDWTSYGAAFPDVAQYYAANQHELSKAGFTTPESFYQWHYGAHGQGEMASGQRAMWSPTGEQPQQAQPAQAAVQAAPDAAPAPVFDSAGVQKFLESTPGYMFTRDQGIQAITNKMAAGGLGGTSGAFGKGLARFVTGLADTTYGEQLNRYGTAAGMGQSAANQTGAFGQGLTTGAASSLVGGANAQAAGITGAAQASAAGTIGASNAVSGGIMSLGGLPLTNRIMGMYGGSSGLTNAVNASIVNNPNLF